MRWMINKDNVLNNVNTRLSELKKVRDYLKLDLSRKPDGALRTTIVRGIPRFYHVLSGEQRGGKYIQSKNQSLINRLAQKEYENNLLKEIEEEIKILELVEKKYHPQNTLLVLEKMHPSKQAHIEAIEASDEEYRAWWEKQEYVALKFPEDNMTDYYTDKGERVRSKSEILIANALNKNNIPYRYEAPLKLRGINRDVYPDFTCLNVSKRKEYVWEHFGMLGDESYGNHNAGKIQQYMASGYFPGKNMIMSFESLEHPFGTNMAQRIINEYLT